MLIKLISHSLQWKDLEALLGGAFALHKLNSQGRRWNESYGRKVIPQCSKIIDNQDYNMCWACSRVNPTLEI